MTEASEPTPPQDSGHLHKEFRVEKGQEGYILSYWNGPSGRWIWGSSSSLDDLVQQLTAYLEG